MWQTLWGGKRGGSIRLANMSPTCVIWFSSLCTVCRCQPALPCSAGTHTVELPAVLCRGTVHVAVAYMWQPALHGMCSTQHTSAL